MANRKPIPHINVPIMQANGSMELAWYLFLQWVSENAGTTDLSDYFTKEETQALLDAKANINDLADVAFSGSYNDLSNKPTIGNATITIKQGGVTKGSFTVNQTGDEEIDIDQGGSDIDNLTITKNADDEMQAIGVINKNTETGATNPIYDWVGTEEEYETQNIATLHPEWLCFITDDCESTDSIIVRREVAERNIGELVYSLVPITDSGLHLLDGDLLDGAGIYADFYDYMADIQATAPQIFCSEADWQTSISTYGVCGKFVIDTANHTIRLPKVTGFVEGTVTSSALGDLVAAGLPNITGSFAADAGQSSFYADGAFYTVSNVATGRSWDMTSTTNYALDASRSSSIYGNSDTVQPQAVKGYIYIVLANTVKTEIEVDIDNIVTDLDNKVTKGHEVIEFQAPTAQNNYTWYRKYADGWVEQGGLLGNAGTFTTRTITMPIAMLDANYTVVITGAWSDSSGNGSMLNQNKTTTTFGTYATNVNNEGSWQVGGMAA